MDLKYSHIDILVSDLDQAVQYYQRVLGCTPSKKQVWKRGDFHVEYVIMFKDNTRFYFVRPFSGNLKEMLDKKGPGTIYRFCFTSQNIKTCFRELIAAGVKPENENGQPMTEDDLASPAGIPIIWLPKIFGDLSMEILEEKAMEERMSERRREVGLK
jgi:methylmalonyl-CoA/ethylmalonyl-CoA epimerase